LFLTNYNITTVACEYDTYKTTNQSQGCNLRLLNGYRLPGFPVYNAKTGFNFETGFNFFAYHHKNGVIVSTFAPQYASERTVIVV